LFRLQLASFLQLQLHAAIQHFSYFDWFQLMPSSPAQAFARSGVTNGLLATAAAWVMLVPPSQITQSLSLSHPHLRHRCSHRQLKPTIRFSSQSTHARRLRA
jgi:hypothetical protein